MTFCEFIRFIKTSVSNRNQEITDFELIEFLKFLNKTTKQKSRFTIQIIAAINPFIFFSSFMGYCL